MRKIKSYSGFFILLLSAFFYAALVFAQGGGEGSGGGWNPQKYNTYGLPQGTIYAIIEGLMKWGLSIFGFIGIIGFVISGIMYLTAAGDEEQQKKAKRAMYYSLVGVIVGLVGLVIIVAVDQMLGGGATQY